MFFRAATVGIGICVAALGGCSGSDYPPTAIVRGEVTIDGKPLEAGTIIFFPEQGNQAMGEVKNGKYELRTFSPGDGAVAGKYRVTISAVEVVRGKPRDVDAPPGSSPDTIRSLMMEAASEQIRWIAPQKYSNLRQTPLVAEVLPDTENEIDFALDSK